MIEDLTKFDAEMELLEEEKGPNKWQVPGEKISKMMKKWELEDTYTDAELVKESNRLWEELINFESLLADSKYEHEYAMNTKFGEYRTQIDRLKEKFVF